MGGVDAMWWAITVLSNAAAVTGWSTNASNSTWGREEGGLSRWRSGRTLNGSMCSWDRPDTFARAALRARAASPGDGKLMSRTGSLQA